MSRFTAGNVFKALLALLFSVFVAFFVLLIGIGAKNKKVMIEGALYAGVFILAFSLTGPEGSALYNLTALAGLGSMAVAAVRCFMLRDLWLPRKNHRPQREVVIAQQHAPFQPAYQQAPPAPGYAPSFGPSASLVVNRWKQHCR
ncbi:hypothetical protein [Arthrobacter sp. Ld5]|uniref:hypothetical protein n=1 Tax=Arthrobacter sp. Ld5 TaxID=649152 RepID=UPI003EB8756F